MSVYDINYKSFVGDFLPPDKRAAVNVAYITDLLKPLETLHVSTFGPFRDGTISDAKENGQRILIESVLNTAFSVITAPYIYIDNSGDDVAPLVLFQIEENLLGTFFYQETELLPVYLSQEQEVNNNREFKVFVPTAVYAANGENKIRVQVDRLRPYSTIYSIIQY